MGVTCSWSTEKNAANSGQLRMLANIMKASASSRFKIRMAAMKDIPYVCETLDRLKIF